MFAKPLCRTYELISQQLKQAKKVKKVQIKVSATAYAPSSIVVCIALTRLACFHGWGLLRVAIHVQQDQSLCGRSRYSSREAYSCVSTPFIILSTSLIISSWSAVVRGAVVKGLEGNSTAVNTVAKRKCRRHYGAGSCPVFDPNKHVESEAFIDQYDGHKRASNQMSWLVKKGQDLPTSRAHHAKLAFIVSFWPGESRIQKLDLYAAESATAPKRRNDKVSRRSDSTYCILTDVRMYTRWLRSALTSASCLTTSSRLCEARQELFTTAWTTTLKSPCSLLSSTP